MNDWLKIGISFILFWWHTTSIVAQKFSYTQYNATHGAPFDEVKSVIHDDEGFLWIGSPSGLYRFDGNTYENFGIQIKSQNIHKVRSHDGKLFFINDTGIHQFDNLSTIPKFSTLIEGNIIENPKLPFYPNNLMISNDQEIWLSQSNHSVGKLDQDIFQTFPFTPVKKSQQIDFEEAVNGEIWALSPMEGLFLFDQANNTFEKKLPILNGQDLMIHDRQLLIGGDDLYGYTLQNNNRLQLQRTIKIDDDRITSISLDKKNQYIIGTQKGKLYLLKDIKSNLKTIYGANESHRVEELNFGKINQIYIPPNSTPKNGAMWICSETGLWLLKQTFFETVTNLPKNNPIGVGFNSKGKAFVPLNGVYEISFLEDDFVAQQINKKNQVTAVAVDISDDLWMSTAWPKVELLKVHNNTITKRYSFKNRGEDIFYLYSDSRKNLWFCQAPSDKPIVGVGKINANGQPQLYDESKGFSNRILVIKESSRGEIYAAGIGEKSYLYHYDAAQDQFVNLSPPLPFEPYQNFEVHDLTIDDRGVVWLASTDGLLRYDSEKTVLIQNDLLKQEEVRGVAHLGEDKIWVATATKGLIFHQNNTSTSIGETAGLPAIINAYRCLYTDKNGRVWAGTAEGLVYSRTLNAALPLSNQPRIKKVLIDGKVPKAKFADFIKMNEKSKLNLSLTNLYFPSRNIQYQYRLIPKEIKDIMLEEYLWESSANNNKITFDGFNVGNYFLEIRSKQEGGYQWSLPLVIPLKIVKPWYLKPWFLYPFIAIIVLMLGYYFRFFMQRRINNLQEILKFAQSKLAERETELHQKMIEFDVQHKELVNVNSNINTLELFVKLIPEKATWNDIITAMGKAVDESIDIDAFEICFVENNEIIHKGYSNLERGGYTFRSKPFNSKTSLTSWVMANQKEVVINDFDNEHTLYIERKKAYRFKSLVFVPFNLKNKQVVALSAYNTQKNAFDKNDLVMFRVLTRFIISSADQEIKKTV